MVDSKTRVYINFLEWHHNKQGKVNYSQAVSIGYDFLDYRRSMKKNVEFIVEELIKRDILKQLENEPFSRDVKDIIKEYIDKYNLEKRK